MTLFISAGELPATNGNTTYSRDSFRAHSAAVQVLADSGVQPPDAWLSLRNRYGEFFDMPDRAVDALITEIIQPTGADLVALRANALAEHAGHASDTSDINRRLQTAVLDALTGLYRPVAARNYKEAAAGFDAAAQRFTIAAGLVDLEANADALLAATPAQREAWIAAPTLAADLDQARNLLFAAASLIDTVSADVCFTTAANDTATVAVQISLCCNTKGAHRRRVWEAWATKSGRTGPWAALLRIGVTLRAGDPTKLAPYQEPQPLVPVVGRSGRVELWDRHDGDLQHVLPGFQPASVGWLAEKPQTQAVT